MGGKRVSTELTGSCRSLQRWLGPTLRAGGRTSLRGSRAPKLGLRRCWEPADGLHCRLVTATSEGRSESICNLRAGHIFDELSFPLTSLARQASGYAGRELYDGRPSFLRVGLGKPAARFGGNRAGA